jgi:hypothetical protein
MLMDSTDREVDKTAAATRSLREKEVYAIAYVCDLSAKAMNMQNVRWKLFSNTDVVDKL